MRKKSLIPEELRVVSVVKQSISIFWKNLLFLFSVAIAIEFTFYFLFKSVESWTSENLQIDISPVTPILILATTTIFLIFAFHRLARDELEPSSSPDKSVFSLHRVSTYIRPQMDSEWRALRRTASIVAINWVIVFTVVQVGILAAMLISLMKDTMSSVAFWPSVVVVGLGFLATLLCISYIAIRIWLVIPIVVTEDMTIRRAIVYSWKITACCADSLFRLNTIIVTVTLFLVFPVLATLLAFVLLLLGVPQVATATVTEIFSDAVFAGFITTVTAVCFHRVKQLQPQDVGDPDRRNSSEALP